MTKYHLKDNGDPGKCSAQPGKCPKTNDDGTPQEHFNSKHEAQVAFENSKNNFPKSIKNKATKKNLESLKSEINVEDYRELDSKKNWTKNERNTLQLFSDAHNEIKNDGYTSEDTQRNITALHFAKEQISTTERTLIRNLEKMNDENTSQKTQQTSEVFSEPEAFENARNEMVRKYNSHPIRIKSDQRNMMIKARKMDDDKLGETLEIVRWKDRKDLEAVLQDERNKRKQQKQETFDYQRNEFFTRSDQLSNYTLIDPETGSVFSTNSMVMEEPDSEDFYEFPENFTKDYNAKSIEDVRDLSEYKTPVIVERDTELVVDARNVHAVNHGKEIIDFDEILESDQAASDTAYSQGFSLWDN